MSLNFHIRASNSIEFLLEKLREIAAVPSRVFFMNEMVQVSSLLLLQAGFGNVCIEKVRPTWPTPASEFFDWNQHFVFPVQAAVIKVANAVGNWNIF